MTVNVYHKHSVVKDKAPEVKQIELGEIAINANQDSPALYIKDSADRIIQIGGDITSIINDIQDLHDLIDKLNDILPNPIDGETNLIQLLTELGDLKAQVDLNAKCCADAHEEIEKIKDRIDALESQLKTVIEKILKSIAALEAQCLLLAQHNVEQDGRLDDIEKELEKIDVNINEIAKKVGDLEVAVDALKGISFEAGEGIIIKDKGNYQYKISLNKKWLDKVIAEALKPYALIDFGTNTDELK